MKKIPYGTYVKIKDGATKWMKERDYWLVDFPESVDGFIGVIIADYTNLPGEDSHYGINIPNSDVPDDMLGVNPMWLEIVNNNLILGKRMMSVKDGQSASSDEVGTVEDVLGFVKTLAKEAKGE